MKKTKNILTMTLVILISSFIPGLTSSNSKEDIWKIQLKEELKPAEDLKILIESQDPKQVDKYILLEDKKTLIFSTSGKKADNIKLDKDYKLLSKRKLKEDQVKIGDSEESLIYSRGIPSRIDRSKKHTWYTYVDEDFKNYSLYYLESGEIKSIYLSKEDILPKYKIKREMNKNHIEKKFKDKKLKGKNIENTFLIDKLNYKFIYDPFAEDRIQGVLISDPKVKLPQIDMNKEILRIYEKQILDLTNVFRAINNKSILKHNEELQKLAIQYSKYMADNNHFSHYDKEGRNVADRVKEYTNLDHNVLIENLAYGYRTPVGVNEGWIHSKDHRAGMLHDLPEELGVGIHLNKKVPYYTSIFFRSKESARKKKENKTEN